MSTSGFSYSKHIDQGKVCPKQAKISLLQQAIIKLYFRFSVGLPGVLAWWSKVGCISQLIWAGSLYTQGSHNGFLERWRFYYINNLNCLKYC